MPRIANLPSAANISVDDLLVLYDNTGDLTGKATISQVVTTGIGGASLTFGDIIAANGTFSEKVLVTLSGLSAETAGIEIKIDTQTATQQGIYVHNHTNFAHAGEMGKFRLVNGTDSGNVVRVENNGTGKNISSANDTSETFSVSKAGDIVLNGNLTKATSSPPASAAASGTTGRVEWDSGFVYICTATNTWKRVAIATW